MTLKGVSLVRLERRKEEEGRSPVWGKMVAFARGLGKGEERDVFGLMRFGSALDLIG